MSKANTILILKYSFTLVGLCLLLGAYYTFDKTQSFLGDSMTAQGTVISLEVSESSDSTTYKPRVEFTTADGELVEFTSSFGSKPPSHSKGDIVTVFYKQSAPEQAKINSFFSLWGGALIMTILGLVFFGVGFSIVLLAVLKRRKIEWLKTNGIKITAQFQTVQLNRGLKINHRYPYQVVAQWQNPTTSKMHIFTSENIWFDPTGYINSDEVTVLIERGNPKKYNVDTSFLPETAK